MEASSFGFQLYPTHPVLDKCRACLVDQASMTCGLCESTYAPLYYKDEKRDWDYFRCTRCDLVFRDPETYLSHEDEKARYATHDNSIANEGYVKFLTPAVETLLPHLKKGDLGLDFGCGPGPIIEQLFAPHEIKVNNFDPYFAYQPHYLDQKYDFVTMTEVFEHLTIPFKEFMALDAVMKPKAYLLIMTEPYRNKEHFANWGYRMDPTHICFLNEKTLNWLANEWNYEVLSSEGRIFLLRKKS